MSESMIPTTEEVRDAFWAGASGSDIDLDDRYYPFFDRWLVHHDAEVAASALRDAAGAMEAAPGPSWASPDVVKREAQWLRDRAAAVEADPLGLTATGGLTS